MFDVKNLSAIEISLASPERIRKWSRGEITKSETINYRTQKPEADGLFCEKIFGPSKDYECHCGKYKKIRHQGIVCDKCGVEVISKSVRRDRVGHIELATPCTHIWYLKSLPSRISLLLEIPPKALEEIIYFAAHVCLNPGTSKVLSYRQFLDEITARNEFIAVIKEFIDTLDKDSADYQRALEYIEKLGLRNEAFDFLSVAAFISRHTKAEFGDGAEAIKKLLEKVDLDEELEKVNREIKDASGQKRLKLLKRLEVIEAFRNSDNKPEWMVLDVIPVIPPDLRPMLPLDGGRNAVSDINDLYRRVINRNNRLKRLIEIHSPSVVLKNEKRMVQEAVDALIDNGRRNKPVTGTGGRALKSLSVGLRGKQGRFRQNLLGKRVDYSGRSVIAVGPDLKMYQCGLPREIAINLLRPYIAHILIKEKIVSAHKQADKMIDQLDHKVYDIVERIISDHPVLLNRAPTLHRLGIQAFQPKLVDGRAIRLHPLVCTGFNADFDGDQMGVYVPLSLSAQEEALDRMLASNNILGPKDGKPIVTPSQDMVLGNYYLTLEETSKALSQRASRRKASGDVEEYILLETYSKSEGKVFGSIDEVIHAYNTKNVHIHTRIALRGSALKKVDGIHNLLDSKNYISAEEIANKYVLTTIGKVMFNLIFPTDFPFLNDLNIKEHNVKLNLKGNLREFFISGKELENISLKDYICGAPLRMPFDKNDLSTIIDEVYHRYGTSKTSAVLDKMKDQGFKFATTAGFTIALSDITTVKGKAEIIAKGDKQIDEIQRLCAKGLYKESERHKKVTDVWTKVRDDVRTSLEEQFKKDRRNPIFMMCDSGARGNIGNIAQLSGMRGLMSSPSGETIELPIKSCFREGQTVSEFFTATHGARKGGADTALKTADSGYLTRRLVDVSQDVIVREEDCHTDKGFKIREIRDSSKNIVIVPLYDRLVGRYLIRDVKHPITGEVIASADTLVDEIIATKIVESGIKEVEIRSLFGCQTKNGVCVRCYGRNLATGNIVKIGEAIGIMAAQSIGEPGTQLTMRTFHSGGIAGTDITQGLPRVQELVEARSPKGEALISDIAGTVSKIVEEGGKYTISVTNDNETLEHKSSFGAHLRVKEGDHVINGGKLTEGAVSPKHLLEVSDSEAVQVYILKEIQKVYRAQGISISDKHIEVIVKQMLKKVIIVDSGDTSLVPGTKMDIEEFSSVNEDILVSGGRPAIARQLILGITKAALEVKSFLSAASFQETTRILTDAAIKAKRDELHGLKENVITGKLIPAGTGLIDEEEHEDMISTFSVQSKMDDVKQQYIEKYDDNLN